ncbi:hypothetical protein P3T76_002426 [Phytophthora citrophthora]|uniref:Uncharacterized protein n=1 Tax=Phytophthora citrophthora TaxID=4793 RepID=A0AAD9GXG5_9STRA|nr:hypothetical protein P3T76_002426 [Phytophthora citrophthora]
MADFPTAGYIFAEELDIHYFALDDFHSMLLQDDSYTSKDIPMNSFSRPTGSCSSPSSPSSVVYLPPCYPPTDGFDQDSPFIKQELLTFTPEFFTKPEPKHDVDYRSVSTHPQPVPVRVVRSSPANEENKERLRRRQRGYEKRYRGRKRRDLKSQRDTWLALELKLDATRQKYCKPYIRVEQDGNESLRYKLLLLKLEERALRHDKVSMETLEKWEQISRIREYSDKDELRTISEWRHSADKVIGFCAGLGLNRFHPYAPMPQRHFRW